MARKRRPVLGRDYIICDDGRAQFTREFLASRGWCCEHDCRFCPYPPEIRYASKRLQEEAQSGAGMAQLTLALKSPS